MGSLLIMHSSTVPEKNEIFHLSTNLRKLNVLCSKLLKLLFLKHESKIYGPRSGWILGSKVYFATPVLDILAHIPAKRVI
jgi:hypothetical protein